MVVLLYFADVDMFLEHFNGRKEIRYGFAETEVVQCRTIRKAGPEVRIPACKISSFWQQGALKEGYRPTAIHHSSGGSSLSHKAVSASSSSSYLDLTLSLNPS